MTSLAPGPRSVLPVLYVGRGLTRRAHESLWAHRVGVVVAEDAARARRLLAHFRVGAIVMAVPDLRGLMALIGLGIPVIVLAARDAACDLDGVTILPRGIDPEELAAVIHGLRRETVPAARDAA